VTTPVPISGLAAAGALQAGAVLPIDQDQGAGLTTYKATIAGLGAFLGASGVVRRPEDHGTITGTNDIAAIDAAVAAMNNGDTLLFSPGVTYAHNNILLIEDLSDVKVRAHGATILATAQANSAVWLENLVNSTFEGGTLRVVTDLVDGSNFEMNKVMVGSCERLGIRDVYVDSAKAAGIFLTNCNGFVVERCIVYNTLRDHIHMTGGCRYGKVIQTVSTEGGDDGVAIISYLGDPAVCHHIDIISPRVWAAPGARGLAVVGGHHINMVDVDINRSAAAAIYIAIESSDFDTYGTSDIKVQGGRIAGANTNAGYDHGAILLFSELSGGTISNVDIANLVIEDTANGGNVVQFKKGGSTGTVSGITLRHLKYVGTNPGTGSYSADGGMTAPTVTNVVRRTY
jgi:hypothetical protein